MVRGKGCWLPGLGAVAACWPAAGATGAVERSGGLSAGCFAGWLAAGQGSELLKTYYFKNSDNFLEGRAHWAVYYTSPQSYMIPFSYSLA